MLILCPRSLVVISILQSSIKTWRDADNSEDKGISILQSSIKTREDAAKPAETTKHFNSTKFD